MAIWALQSNSFKILFLLFALLVLLWLLLLLKLKLLLLDVEFKERDDKDDVNEDDENRLAVELTTPGVLAYDDDDDDIKIFGDMRPDIDELATHSLTLSKLVNVFLATMIGFTAVLVGLGVFIGVDNDTHDIDFCSFGGRISVAWVRDCGSCFLSFCDDGACGGGSGGKIGGNGVVKSSKVIVIWRGCKWKSDVL